MRRRPSRSSLWITTALAVACAPPEARRPDLPPAASADEEPRVAEPDWTTQAGLLAGVTEDTGTCVVTSGWDAAELWAKAFRLPEQLAPAKGSEIPTAKLDRIEVTPGPPGTPAGVRLYRQTVDYHLAGEREVRRFVMAERTDAGVAGCAVSERVVDPAREEPLTSVRIERVGDLHFELTNRSLPDARGMVTFGSSDIETSFRHVCTLSDHRLGCVSMPGETALALVPAGLRYERSGLGFFERSGPFLLPLAPGLSVVVGDPLLNVTKPIEGRAMARGLARSAAPRTVEPRVDPAVLSPFRDHGACVTIDAKSKPSERIGDRTAKLWAESFMPRGRGAALSTSAGELVPGYPVELIGGTSLTDGPGTFVFVATPDHIAGCALEVGRAAYRLVNGSFKKHDERRFSFRLEHDAVSMIQPKREERLVLCALNEHDRLDCESDGLRERATLKSP